MHSIISKTFFDPFDKFLEFDFNIKISFEFWREDLDNFLDKF